MLYAGAVVTSHECMHAVTMPVYVVLHCQVSGMRMALTHCVMNQRLLFSQGPTLLDSTCTVWLE